MTNHRSHLTLILILFSALAACSSPRVLITDGFSPSAASPDSLLARHHNFGKTLNAVSGKGRAIISEPGNSERLTIDFSANTELSLLTIQNRIGIEGGQLLVSRDSILIYNKIDKEAHIISVHDGRRTSLNELASVNILELLNFTFRAGEVEQVYENEEFYRLRLFSGTQVFLAKASLEILRVEQPQHSGYPYSEITYEAYGEIEGLRLPRRATIISADKKSKVAFLIQTLDINPRNLDLQINIPKEIIIQRL